MAEYNKLKTYVPNNWKNILTGIDNVHVIKTNCIENPKQATVTEDVILMNDSEVVIQVKTKEIYVQCLYPPKKPTCNQSGNEAWKNILGHEISWKEVFKFNL